MRAMHAPWLPQVQALAALNDNVLVSGANDGSLCVWARSADGRSFGNVFTSLGDHTNMLRAVLALPPCGLCPEGGFATACLDKLVRVFTYSPSSHAVACVATLAGHQGGVDSLALTSLGQLLSGGRDGQARVWDLATGAPLQVLANHENKVVVCGLAGGAIATGSAGRKNEAGQHVDYKLRLWKCTPGAGAGGAPAWSLERTIADHEQAIQDLDAMPGGEGFLSASNDGTVRVRDAEGAALERISTPPNAEGAPTAVYRARLLHASMWIAGCCEDNAVRLWCTDTLPAPADELRLPGTPWAVVGLANGDVAVGCTHAASGKIGHVYLFTQDAARAAPEAEVAAFVVDCTPPARSSEGGGGGSGSGSGAGVQRVHISGLYDARHTTPGGATALGGYGFFRQPDGGIFVCTWTGAAWDDVGVAEGLEGDDGHAGGSSSSGGGYDFSQAVEMETQAGVAKVPLRWNDGDDLDDVAAAFCKANGVPAANVGQVRTFMVNTMAQRGLPPGGRKQREAEAAAAAAAARPPTLAARLGLTLIPSRTYVDATAVDWKKLLPKLSELNASVASAGGVACTAEEEAWLRDAAATLADTSRYHSSKIAPAALAPLSAKVLATWPASHIFPALDYLRVAVSHPSGAEAVAAMPALLPALFRVAGSAGEAERPAALLVGRLLFNLLKSTPGRALLLRSLSALLPACAALLRFPHASVALGASVVLHNLARALSEGQGQGLAAAAPSDFAGVLALAAQGLASAEEDVRLNALLALGTLLYSDAESGKSWCRGARGAGMEAIVAGLVAGKTEKAAQEVLRLLELE